MKPNKIIEIQANNSPFPRLLQCNGDWENSARKRGCGKYNFNMADADLIQSRKDDLQEWLKARRLETTGRKQELIVRVLKAKQNDIEKTI